MTDSDIKKFLEATAPLHYFYIISEKDTKNNLIGYLDLNGNPFYLVIEDDVLNEKSISYLIRHGAPVLYDDEQIDEFSKSSRMP